MSVQWDARLQAVELPKSMVNALVLDWLVNQGHHDAAAAFVRESGTPAGDLDGIAERMSIRQAVEAGRMQAALEALEALHPALLSVDPPNGGSDLQLLFALQQQHFIELVRAGDVAAALTHAQHKLAPLAEAQPALVEPLELTMMLARRECRDPPRPRAAEQRELRHRGGSHRPKTEAPLAPCSLRRPTGPTRRALTCSIHRSGGARPRCVAGSARRVSLVAVRAAEPEESGA